MQCSRRDFFNKTTLSALGLSTIGLYGSTNPERPSGRTSDAISQKVFSTPLIDTHEHIPNESERVKGTPLTNEKNNDWTVLLNQYIASDLLSAGMPREDYLKFISKIDPVSKWKYLEPWWPMIKTSGNCQALLFTLRELYGIDDINASTVRALNQRYLALIKPGFYKRILKEKGNILSCQTQRWPFIDSEMPEFVMPDLDVTSMYMDPGSGMFAGPAGINPTTLDDWKRVIDWWFDRIAPKAIAYKVSSAYRRSLDFDKVTSNGVNKIYGKIVNHSKVNEAERKEVEDHLFWYVLNKIEETKKPLKIHTGYHAQWEDKSFPMDLYSVRNNVCDAFRLCEKAPGVEFVFFHIAYPYYEETLALVKQYKNANVDMVWSWILDPVAAVDFFKKAILTIPVNKILPFGGDHYLVELTYGQSQYVRTLITKALNDLVRDFYLSENDALSVIDQIFYLNAKRIYKLKI